ncbi:MAG: S8 family serine peptidase [Coprococcus sp.]
MRKERLLRRLLALVLVISVMAAGAHPVRADETDDLTFTQVDNSTVSAELPDREKVSDRDNTPEYGTDDIVRVSIILEKESTIGAGYDTQNIAWNRDAMSYRERLQEMQDKMISMIENYIDGDLDVVWNLTLAANLISANVEYGQIDKIRELNGVQNVVLETRYEPAIASKGDADPNMATSGRQIGSSAAWASGYTGAGSRVAVIDTGIDVGHLSFDADAYEYSLEQLAEKAGVSAEEYIADLNLLDTEEIRDVADQMNADIDSDEAYVSAKIPFGYNYVDLDYDITHLNDNEGDHGSHVTGIAAANAYVPDGDGFSNALDSVYVQGVAPDAQILTMKVFGRNGGAYDSDYMAAIEDAIVLGADCINLSLGSGNPGMSDPGVEAYQTIMDNLVQSGVVVSISSGNSGSWVENAANIGYLYSDDVSMDTVGSPGSLTNSLAVASVENDGTTGMYLSVDDILIFYTESDGFSNNPMTSIAGEHEYILIDGTGSSEDWGIVGDALEGRIAICSRGSITFSEKGNSAVEAGAIAAVIYNNQSGIISMDLSDYEYTEPCVSILQSDGDILRDAAVPVSDDEGNVLYYMGTLTVGNELATSQYDSEYYTMSSFSSWGVPGSLELKPEITAPGGNIYSVNGANAETGLSSHNSYISYSGTSMAAPQIAGMAALAAQYIRENDLDDKTGLDARTLTQSLLMSTAEPMIDGDSGSYYSILQQGAGLANIGNVITADSYILMGQNATESYTDGKVKAELGDDPERNGVYSFSFTINNLTDEDKMYTLSADIFAQDAFAYYANSNESEDELALYMDTWTIPLAAGISWSADGKSVQSDAGLSGMDFNGDGTINTSDGQALLDYAAGVISQLANEGKADMNGDGIINSYDAYLFLSRLSSGTVQVAADSSVTVNVTIALSEDEKESLDANFENGAYIEGFIYAAGVSSSEGVAGTVHSIPMLGFYGSWTDPSMFDVGSKIEYDYGEEIRDPYLGNTDANAFSVIYADDPDNEYYFGGNPLVADDVYIPERNAVSEGSEIANIYFTSIRNAADSRVTVSNLSTGELLISEELGSIDSAFYYTNGDSWQYTNRTLNMGLVPSELEGWAEGDILEICLTLAPEYYADSQGNVNWDALGAGADFSIPVVIDNTAPELKEVSINSDENLLDVTVEDNQYIAAVALFDEFGDYLYTYQGSQTDVKAGDTCEYSLDLTDVDGAKFLLQVYDYAMNTTTYEINQQIGEVTDTVEGVDISDESLVLVKGGEVTLTASVQPVNATDRRLTWSSSDESIATVDENGVVTGVAEGSCVITAASAKEPDITAACNVTVVVIDSTLQGVLQDTEGTPMFFDWDLKNSDTWNGGTELDTTIAAAAADVHTGQLYIQDSDDWAMHKIDAATGESIETSGSCAFGFAMSDLASAGYYSSESHPLLAGIAECYFLQPTDPMENTFNQGWDLSEYLSEYTGGTRFVALAYYGYYQDDSDGTIYDEYLALDDAGYIWVLDNDGTSGLGLGFLPTTLNAKFADYAGYQFSSMVCDEDGNLYLSAFNGSTNVIYYLTFNADTSTFDSICLGNFGDDVWPAVLTEAASNGDATSRTVSLDDAAMVARDIAVESLSAGSGTRAPAGGLNAVVTVADSQERPMSVGSASDDGKYYTVTITARDAQGIDVDATNGVITVTYDSEKLELVDIAVKGDYQSVRDVRGEVTFGYVDLTGIAAGDDAAELIFNVIDDSASDIIIDHKEVNDMTSGYREVVSVGSEQEIDETESTETESEATESETIESETTESEITESETGESDTSVKPGNDKETKPSSDNNTNDKTDAPKTGDNTPITFLIILLVVSGFGIAAAILYKRKLR